MTLNRMRIAVIAAAGLLMLAGCSSGASQEQLDAAREAGASEAQKQLEEQQTLEDLQDKVDELKEQKQESRAEARKARKAARKAARRAENNNNNGGGGGGGASGLSGPVTACGDGIYAGANTSCSFAMNVAGEWGSTPRTVLEAYSPVTGQYYTMTCSSWSGGGHVCTGGNNASVYFP